MDFSHNSLTDVPEGILNFDQLNILALVSNPWTDETKRRLADFAKELRQKNAIVHLNSFDENQQ
jgi:Leucine-rich repeat (LRR) protein